MILIFAEENAILAEDAPKNLLHGYRTILTGVRGTYEAETYQN